MPMSVIEAFSAFVFCVVFARCAENGSLGEQLHLLPGSSVASLPPRSLIGGNLIRGDKWYVLTRSEMLAVRSILNRKPSIPRVGEAIPPPLVDRIALWGISGGEVVLLDVVAVDDSVTLVVPLGRHRRGLYVVGDWDERHCLRELMKRVNGGKEKPVVEGRVSGVGK